MLQILINALAFYVTSYIVSGVIIGSWQTLLVISIVWGIITLIVKPIIILLTLPINILTLGLFTFFINAGLLLLMSNIVPNFIVDGFGTAFIASIILSIVNIFLTNIIK